ncbi:MAG: DUF4870 domain-containing protein [Arenimonas sp.]|nr:DUF4870 domain-containing protein [Arenimonas sp.]MBP7916941.1 DUF4870 domain-containing protein [Arenimonas sp.]
MSDTSASTIGNDRKLAFRAHIWPLVFALASSWIAANFLTFRLLGVGGVLFALIFWATQTGGAAFVRRHAAEAFNFNLSMFLYSLAFLVIWELTNGMLFLLMLPIGGLLLALWIFCPLIAAKTAKNGNEYRYPITLHIMK